MNQECNPILLLAWISVQENEDGFEFKRTLQLLVYVDNINILVKTNGKDKGEVLPVFLFLTEHHAMKVYWGVEL